MQDSLVEKFSSEDIVFFGLLPNKDAHQDIVDYVTENGITFDMLYNADEVIDSYGAHNEPTTVLLDREGQIRFRVDNVCFHRTSELIMIIQQLIED